MGNKNTGFSKLPEKGRLSSASVEKLWNHYAVVKDGYLSKRDLAALLKHLLQDLKAFVPNVAKQLAIAYASDIRTSSQARERNPKFWENYLNQPFDTLLGKLEELVGDVYTALDADGDGQISKRDFTEQFVAHIRQRVPADIWDCYMGEVPPPQYSDSSISNSNSSNSSRATSAGGVKRVSSPASADHQKNNNPSEDSTRSSARANGNSPKAGSADGYREPTTLTEMGRAARAAKYGPSDVYLDE